MHDARLAEVVEQLTVARKAREQSAETAVELRCCSGETVAVGNGNSEHICLDLLRRNGFDVDPHRGAMLSDAPPSLSLDGASPPTHWRR